MSNENETKLKVLTTEEYDKQLKFFEDVGVFASIAEDSFDISLKVKDLCKLAGYISNHNKILNAVDEKHQEIINTWLPGQNKFYPMSFVTITGAFQLLRRINTTAAIEFSEKMKNMGFEEESQSACSPELQSGPSKIELFENHQITILEKFENGENYFKLKDICLAVEYNPNEINKAANLISDEYKISIPEFVVEANRICDVVYIEELGVYEFLNRTKAPKAKDFQRFTQKVLKEINHTGSYSLQSQPNSLELSIQTLTQVVQNQGQLIAQIVEDNKNTQLFMQNQFGIINNLVNAMISNQQLQQKHQVIDEYIAQTSQVKANSFHMFKTKMGVKEYIESIGFKTTGYNSTQVANNMVRLGYIMEKDSKQNYLRTFHVEDLKDYLDSHPEYLK